MELKKTRTGDQLVVEFFGRLDTQNTPDAEEEMSGILSGVKHLELDFRELSFISSAGLRLLLLIPLYRSGQHIGSRVGGSRVLYRQAREVVISSKDLIDIYIDGEQLPGSQFHLKVLPGALPLRLPPKEE